MHTYRILVSGTVQGVGFRPFVYQLAVKHKLCGRVSNGTQGVEIVLNASSDALDYFLLSVRDELPPLASIDHIQCTETDFQEFDDFQIIGSDDEGEKTVRIPPDMSICSECEKELFDPDNRRYGYPFITCTHCGVRYSIIYDLPYDRKNTSMKFFKMCKVCEAEYNDPLDRRYHAQPIGCYDCGPQLTLVDSVGRSVPTPTIIEKASKLLGEGEILAVKGVGGYHLMCDATNKEAIAKLRERKQRPTKPFAVMVRDMTMARELGEINDREEALLVSRERPIVIVGVGTLRPTDGIAPNISRIGLFLPYTPLHLLLLEKLKRPLVATSANVTDEPICTDRESLEKLSDVYDYILDHDREIVNGVDDSVVMAVKDRTVMLRRARGYAPASIQLPFKLSRKTLAMGTNQKSTVAIGFDDQVILSPHIGDLGSIGSVEYYQKNIETLERIYDFILEIIAYDKHPGYESTKVATQLFTLHSSLFTKKEVQHHYAHILGVMAEKQISGKVFGVAFDGTGYGDDGNLWGGEFMICDYEGYERVAHLNYFKLLGGAKAIKEPRRVALSLLFDLYGDEVLKVSESEASAPNKTSPLSSLPTLHAFSQAEIKIQYLMWKKGLNAPVSSSIGRLFDAVASLLGVCQVMHFEGESGMLLEELYDDSVTGAYCFSYENGKIDMMPMLKEMLTEIDTAVAVSKFFHALIEMIATVYEPHDELPLVLSGGVFQNRILLTLVLERFPEAIIPNAFPPNDGGIALGQVVASAH